MNKLIRLFIFCFSACILFACSEDDNTTESVAPFFGVAGDDRVQIFTGDSEIKYVTVNTNQPFTVTSSDPSWCTVEIVDDKVDNLKITVSQNALPASREAQVTVSTSGFDNVTVNVTQVWTSKITTDKSYVLLTNNNLEFNLKVTANIDYEMELPDWVQVKDNQPDGTYIFEFSPIAPGERSGNIVFKATGENSTTTQSVPIIQRERVKKVGSWLFEDASNLTKATIGKDLIMVRNDAVYPDLHFLSVEGPTSNNKAVRVPLNGHFLLDHGMILKDGRNTITEYTLFFEFKVPAIGRFYSLYQTDLSNASDGEIFIRGSGNPATIGVGATGYAGQVYPQVWYRLYLSFKPGDVKFYMNGQLFHTSTTSDGRFGIDPRAVILCGGPWWKPDDNEFDIAEISIWNGALTVAQMNELEGIE